jgi:hypothetical protein
VGDQREDGLSRLVTLSAPPVAAQRRAGVTQTTVGTIDPPGVPTANPGLPAVNAAAARYR